MKQYVATAFAAFIGVLAAMLVYYRVVTKPGIENEFARVDEARAAAREVGRELEKAADQSVAHAREGLESQAMDQRRREMAAGALLGGQVHKVTIAEFYANSGRLPESSLEAGLPAPEAFASDGVAGIEIESGGVVRIDLTERLAKGASIRLVPTADPATYMLRWRCEATAFPDLARYYPQCVAVPDPKVPALIGADASPSTQPPG